MITPRIYFIVEGETEESFVINILSPHFDRFDVDVEPILLGKRKEIRGSFDRGGTAKYNITLKEIKGCLYRHDCKIVTTMIDFYALHSSYGKKDLPESNPRDKARMIEEKMLSDQDNNPRFVPYLQLHDFEALLFSDPKAISFIVGSQFEEKLNKVRYSYSDPENIDDRKNHCPKHQIKRIISPSHYKEVSMGIPIIQKIGLNKIRKECPHFNEWLTKLETLAEE